MGLVMRMLREEQGAEAAEYALVAGLVSLAIVLGAMTLGGKLSNVLSSQGTCIQTEIASKAPC